MTINKNKTQPTAKSPTALIKTLSSSERKNARILLDLFSETTGAPATLWGNIFGFGSYHYKYESGREGDFLATGFAIRKSGPTIYIMPGYNDYDEILKKLGPHKLGKSCLYIKNLDQIHLPTLKLLIKAGLRDLKKIHSVKM